MLCAKFTDNEFSIYHFAHDTNEQNEEDDNDDTSRITNNNSTDGTFHISIYTNDTQNVENTTC